MKKKYYAVKKEKFLEYMKHGMKLKHRLMDFLVQYTNHFQH